MVTRRAATVRKILELQAEGESLRGIARRLQAAKVPTRSGTGRWHASTVRQILDPAAHAAYHRDYRRRQR